MELMLLPGEYSLARYPLDSIPRIPAASDEEGIYSLTLTGEECSFVCHTERIPSGYEDISHGWAAFKLEGIVDIGLVGVLASTIIPLGKVGVKVFTISTYNTDYVLVKAQSLDSAVSALRGAGFIVGIG